LDRASFFPLSSAQQLPDATAANGLAANGSLGTELEFDDEF
jgi:hypothetical protein